MSTLPEDVCQKIAQEFEPRMVQYGELVAVEGGCLYVVGDGQFDRHLSDESTDQVQSLGWNQKPIQALHRGNSYGSVTEPSNNHPVVSH